MTEAYRFDPAAWIADARPPTAPRGVHQTQAGPGLDADLWEGGLDLQDPERKGGEPVMPETHIRFVGGPEFMAAGDTEPVVLIPRVAIEGCVTSPHGRPRSLKSLSMLVGCVEAAAGLLWWGLYALLRPVRVGLVLEEDGAKLVRQRLAWILAGLGLDRLPEGFRIIVRSGLYLEAPSERREFLERVVAPEDLDILLLDPTRSLFPGVDGGPEKGAPLRRFAREALDVARSVQLIHHDVKPARDAQDGRARAEQASGGQILSVADIPMGFTRLSGRATLVEWSLVKVGTDGPPLRLDFESGTDADGGFKDYLRIAARPADAEDGDPAGTRERVRAWVESNPWKTPPNIAIGTGFKRETVDRLLAQMAAAKLLRMETGAASKARGRHQNARLWGPFDE